MCVCESDNGDEDVDDDDDDGADEKYMYRLNTLSKHFNSSMG